MSDVVVTVPKNFTHPSAPGKRGLAAWLAEGDPPESEWSGQEWWFTTYGGIPLCNPGDRVYVVCEGRLVGYSPLIRCMYDEGVAERCKGDYHGPIAFIRGGGAVACTIDLPITGFRGWRYRWWSREAEHPVDLTQPAGDYVFRQRENLVDNPSRIGNDSHMAGVSPSTPTA